MRERAVRMVFEHADEYPSQWKAIEAIAAKLGINHETLWIWVWRAETDVGLRPGYDNALAESFNSTPSASGPLIYPRGPWRGLDDVEFATLGYVDWFNHRRLHGEITDDASYTTPAEFEAAYYRQTTPALVAVSQTGEQP
jgi:hypothetical protein